MCGRARIGKGATDRLHEVERSHGAERKCDIDPDMERVENLSPGGLCPAIYSVAGGKYEVDRFLWGLIPSYSRDKKPDYFRMFNKRIEALSNPHFRKLVVSRRCVVFLDGFYEWKLIAGRKHPHYVHLEGDKPMQVAAIFDECAINDPSPAKDSTIARRNESDPIVRSVALLTCDACQTFQSMHNRQPVILKDDQMERWLDASADIDALLNELRAVPKEVNSWINKSIAFHPVSLRVTKPSYQEDDCSKRVSLGPSISTFFSSDADKGEYSSPSALTTAPTARAAASASESHSPAQQSASQHTESGAFRVDNESDVLTRKRPAEEDSAGVYPPEQMSENESLQSVDSKAVRAVASSEGSRSHPSPKKIKRKSTPSKGTTGSSGDRKSQRITNFFNIEK